MKETSVGIIPYLVSNRGVEILLMKSAAKPIHWEFVKGKIEDGETFKETCLREVREEIGISLNSLDLENSFIQKNKRKNIILYFVDIGNYLEDEFILDKREVSTIKFFSIDKIPTLAKNQRLLVTPIHERFNKLHFLMKKIRK